MLTYDYAAAQAACEAKGLTWMPDIIPDVDARFTELKLTQAQVDGCMWMYTHYVGWLFSPKTYRWYQRIALAWHFLFGKGFG